MCECNGTLERRISLQELTDFVHSFAPDLEIVIGNNLCERRELDLLLKKTNVHPAVIAACNEVRSKSNFWEDLANHSLCFTKVTDLLSELSSNFSDAEVSDRIKLILTSQIAKAISCGDISQDNLKLSFFPSRSDITRRSLVTSLLPRHEIIPAISQEDCLGNSCNLCGSVCPAEAILDSDDRSKIDKSSCNGCGACVNVCPRGAISYPGYSTVELEREIEALLSKQVELPYRIIALSCQSCFDTDESVIKHCSPSIFTIKVPSLAIVSPLLLLNAFNMGADGIVFIHNEKNCASKSHQELLNNVVHFTHQLLNRWGIDRNRVGYINSSEIKSELAQFADKITALGHTPFKPAAGSMTFEGMYSLAAIIKEMGTKLQLVEEDVLSGEDVPFGVVTIDSTRCTGCNVCAQSCPTGAISTQISSAPSTFKLTFRHDKCIACGLCTSICPEKCMMLSKKLDFAKLSGLNETIFDDEFICCCNCNRPYAAKSMIDTLKRKLEESGVLGTGWTEYCPSCRVAIQQKR